MAQSIRRWNTGIAIVLLTGSFLYFYIYFNDKGHTENPVAYSGRVNVQTPRSTTIANAHNVVSTNQMKLNRSQNVMTNTTARDLDSNRNISKRKHYIGKEQEHGSVVETARYGSKSENTTHIGGPRMPGMFEETAFKNLRVTSLIDIPTNFNFSHETRNVKFTILWYNPARWIFRRSKLYSHENCEYNNCHVTMDRAWLHNSSAIIFGINMGNLGRNPPVSSSERNPDQIWTFFIQEAAVNHKHQDEYKDPSWYNMMNWSMSFNLNSDVLAPYGTFKTRQAVLKRDYDSIYAKKTKMALWFVSNCHPMSRRNEFVSILRGSGLQIDVYGACGKFGRYNGETFNISTQYKFYLSLENSFCKDYVTEKVFDYYNHDIITVVRGLPNNSQLLPNGTFVDAAMFANASSLAQYLMSLGSDKDRYITMMKEKDKYYTLNEDTFGYPFAMCELCRKLNTQNGRRKTYSNLETEVLREDRCVNPKDIIVQ